MPKQQKLTETLITSENIFSGNFIRVMNDKVKLPDGTTASREWVKHIGGAAILALTSNNEIILERQYRHPVQQVVLEIPAGKLELMEDPLATAKRELLEETGYSADSWLELGKCLPCVGYSNEIMHYYLATNLTKGTQCLDTGEFLEVITLPLEECMRLAYTNQITDSKTIAGLMLYHGYLLKQTA